jgi:hypothetical protein
MREAARIRRVFPVATNRRGKRVGVWLGTAFAAAVVGWHGVILLISYGLDRGLDADRRRVLWMLAGITVVFLAGLYDDYRPARRGIWDQVVRGLLAGDVTSGLVKMAAILAASAFVAWMLGARGWKLVLGSCVMAGAANLWNLLDVAPGRALKWFLPTVLALSAAVGGQHGDYALVAASGLGAGAAALVVDLREWSMLGDSGANVLGFIVGIGLFELLAVTGLAVALVVIVALHVVSETFTLSRTIQAAAPLRWFDDLGRIKSSADEHPGQTSG